MNSIDEELDKQKIIENFIIELSKRHNDKRTILDKFNEFKNIYTHKYRHSYAYIFSVVNKIKKESSEDSPFLNIQYNLDYLKEEEMTKLADNDDRYTSVVKFFDHLSLEISRFTVWLEYESRIKKYQNDLNDNQEKLKRLQEKLENDLEENLSKSLIELKNETSKVKTDFVTILSIFAAVIIGFAGVLGFGGNLMANLKDVLIYKAVFMMLISGLVLFNGIFVMLHIIAKLTGRSIAHRCTRHSRYKFDLGKGIIKHNTHYGCDTCTVNNCKVTNKLQIRFPYTTYFNKIFAIGLLATSFTWIMYEWSLWKIINNDVMYLVNNEHITIYIIIGIIMFFSTKKYRD